MKKFTGYLFIVLMLTIVNQVLAREYPPGGGGEGTWVVYRYYVDVKDTKNSPVGNVNVQMTAFYGFYLGGGEYYKGYKVVNGVTNSDGFVLLEAWVDATDYWPEYYYFERMYVIVTNSDYTVLSSTNTASYFPTASGSFTVEPDFNGNKIFDYNESSLAGKFAPIYRFHQNNPLLPMPIEVVYENDHPTILNNKDPNSYLPLPITTHNSQGWQSYFYNILKPRFDYELYNPTVYYQVFKMNIQEFGGDLLPYYVIQYWVYYPYNDAANVHEGDFEHIDVIVNDQNPTIAEAVGAIYYRHNTSKSLSWNQLETIGNHPIVYVGGLASVRLIAKPTKSRPGHEITGASFVADGMHYSVDYPKKLSEGLIAGIVTWRADENVVWNRELHYNSYNSVNMTLPEPLWWMGYPGNWGASPATVRDKTNYETIKYNLPFGIITLVGEFDFPLFSDPPKSPSHKPDRWQKIDKYGDHVETRVLGPITIDGITPSLAVKYTLLGRTKIRIQ